MLAASCSDNEHHLRKNMELGRAADFFAFDTSRGYKIYERIDDSSLKLTACELGWLSGSFSCGMLLNT